MLIGTELFDQLLQSRAFFKFVDSAANQCFFNKNKFDSKFLASHFAALTSNALFSFRSVQTKLRPLKKNCQSFGLN